MTTSAPYGNFSLSQSVISTGVGSGTAPGTISPASDPGSTGTAYVYPTLSFPSTGGFFPTRGPYPFPSGSRYQSASSMVGTSPANPSTGGVYPTHGPYSFSKYPFSTGSGFQSASSSVGTIGTAPADPSTGGVHPTHGPYSFSKHPYPSGSGFQPASSSAGPTDPGISESATIGTAISTIGTAIYQSATSIPSPSGSPTWSTNSTITSATSTFDPSASDTIVLSTTGGTGTGIVTGYPSLLTGVPSTFGTSTKFKYTPTTKILPSEYYYHHRKPHHYHQEEERGYVSVHLPTHHSVSQANKTQGSFDAY